MEPTYEVLNYFRDTQIISIVGPRVRPTLSILNSKTISFNSNFTEKTYRLEFIEN